MSKPESQNALLLLVTGVSGAGRTTALRALEDIGFEGIANLPLPLFDNLISSIEPAQRIAVEIDCRTRNFSRSEVLQLATKLDALPNLNFEIIYLDCADAALSCRYSATRRRHPLAPAGAVLDGIQAEKKILAPIRNIAHTIINSSTMSPHDLTKNIQQKFSENSERPMAISLQSFSYKRGAPEGADLIFDCRFLQNPHWEPKLREKTGTDREVIEFLQQDPLYTKFLSKLTDLLTFLLPAYRNEGKAHLNISIGCTGGRHRSVAVAKHLYEILEESAWQVSLQHREIRTIANDENVPKFASGSIGKGVSTP